MPTAASIAQSKRGGPARNWRSSGIVISVRVLGRDFGEVLDASLRAAILDARPCDLAKEALVVVPWNGCFQANREAATKVCLWPMLFARTSPACQGRIGCGGPVE